ncbi:class I SAM-dependent methyltransferase [Candidatus Margulisiibacteriota bacterium]
MPQKLDETTHGEVVYHEANVSQFVEQAQMDALRVAFYHKRIIDFISARSNVSSKILELGGGSGYDLALFLQKEAPFQTYVFSEISLKMTAYAKRNIAHKKVMFCCIDAQNIPFDCGEFDFVYIMAAFHHLPDKEKALKNLVRVVKNNGYIILGCEPNSWWLSLFSKMKLVLRKVIRAKDHSPADEKAAGFTIRDFNNMAAKNNLKIEEIQPIWFLNGFVHYGLEFIYRVLRLKARIRLPYIIERVFVGVDNFLGRLPIIKNLAWHYTVIYRKVNL